MPRKSRKNVGLIGLGIIGNRVAQSLRAGGFQVFVWNRTPKPAPNFLGAPVEVAEVCEVIQIFVADAAALLGVIDAIGAALTPNHIIICNATVGSEATLEAARRVEANGARFLDAPFTGSKLAAERSKLVYYVGGDDATFKKVEPVLKASSKAILRCGTVGQAAVLKVVTNMITAVTTQTLAEALAIVKKAGLSSEAFALALEHNACRSGVTDLKLPKMVAGDFDPHFSLKHMFKDVQLAIHMANTLDVELPATSVTAGVMYGAMNKGWGDLDFASVFKLYEQAGVAPIEALPPGVSAAAKIEVPAPADAKPLTSEQKSEPAPIEIAAKPVDLAEKPRETGNLDVKPMEVVANVPSGAKPAAEIGGDQMKEPAVIGAAADVSALESNDAEGTSAKKPFNRIKRFFSTARNP